MATILLAIGSKGLQEACRAQLAAGGHAPLLLDRPLAPLSLARKVAWDAACLDGSELGRSTLRVLATTNGGAPVIGLGLENDGLHASIPLPLVGERLLATIEAATNGHGAPSVHLKLDAARHIAAVNGHSVTLTRTEFRLLEVLLARSPADVPLVEVLSAVWGFTEGRGTSELVRAHVRNLRLKLAQIGLGDAMRSRRPRLRLGGLTEP